MKNCKTCGKAIFDAKWGNYKCSEKQIYIYDIDHLLSCSSHSEGKPKESKSNVDYEASMQDD